MPALTLPVLSVSLGRNFDKRALYLSMYKTKNEYAFRKKARKRRQENGKTAKTTSTVSLETVEKRMIM